MEESDMTFCKEREVGMIPLHPSVHCGSPSGASCGAPTASNADPCQTVFVIPTVLKLTAKGESLLNSMSLELNNRFT